VRSLLENHGLPVAGSDARACALADDKAAAKRRLAAAGVPVPPGVVVTSGSDALPDWLTPPLILKPAFEHMSRGLELVQDRDGARDRLPGLLSRLGQPILVEMFIPGREFAVSVVDGPRGLEVLPPLEWLADGGETGVLTEAFKLGDILPGRRDAVRADLAPAELRELADLSLAAFRALGLRDYSRFDVRRSPGGTFFFMEANVTPSMEPEEALALSARWAGMDFPALLKRILSAALGRLPAARATATAMTVELPSGPVRLRLQPGVHVPPPSTLELARLLDVRPGERVLELGCGSGVLSLAAAGLGAGRVVAVDLDPAALASATGNAALNGFAGRIETRAGSWYEPIAEGERFDAIIATPPQTPGQRPFGPRYGGADGAKHLLAVIDGAPGRLDPERGRLWLVAISIANLPGAGAAAGTVRGGRPCRRDAAALHGPRVRRDGRGALRIPRLPAPPRPRRVPRGLRRGVRVSKSLHPGLRGEGAMRRLIVNADDLGADEARNEGIFEAIRAGVVTSASILPNGPPWGTPWRKSGRAAARGSPSGPT
jgi:D-alanine-D-alanine ligase-like ATP-grasp enzyme